MPAEIALDRAGHGAGLHPEQRLLECRAQRAGLLDPAQVAATRLRAHVVGVLARQRREIRARHARLRGQLAGPRFRRLLVGVAGIGRDLHQDVRDRTLLGGGVLRALLLVALAQQGFVDHRHRQLAAFDLDVLQAHGLRATVAGRMRLVPGLDLRGGHRRAVRRHRRHRHEAHVALLAEQAQDAVDLAVGGERGERQPAGDQPVLQAVADLLFELARRLRRSLRRQQHLVAVGVELAVDLEIRDFPDRGTHLAIADHDAVAIGGHAHDLLVDHVVEDLALVLDRLEGLGVECVALFVARAHARGLEALAEFVAVDVVGLPQVGQRPHLRRRGPPRRRLRDPRGVGVHPLRQVGLHPEEGERDDQQAEDDGGDPAGGLVAKFLQHGNVRRGVAG